MFRLWQYSITWLGNVYDYMTYMDCIIHMDTHTCTLAHSLIHLPVAVTVIHVFVYEV